MRFAAGASRSALPRSALGRAIEYVLKYWDGLIVFLDDPQVPLDNNAVERALRGPVIGRKNHHGSKSKRDSGGGNSLHPVRDREAVRRGPEGVLGHRDPTRDP
jgi:hypothetical protein